MAFYQLIKKQFVSASIEEVWEFISSPKNLKEITPDYMGFDITSENLPEKMYAGMIISYKVRPLITDIVSYKPPLYFLGSLANALFIRRQLEVIFAYRENALRKRFP